MKIEFIYSQGLKTAANKAIDKALEFVDAKVDERTAGHAVVDVGKNLPCDTTIIFATDDVGTDEKWNQHVQALPDNKKIVLVSRLVSKDIHLSELIPEKIRKINTIRLSDDDNLDELWDVLSSDKDYYSVISALYSLVEAWTASNGSEIKELHSIPLILKYKKLMKRSLKTEKRPYFKHKIEEINKYLNKSLFDGIIQGVNRISHSYPIIIVLILGAIFIVAQIKGIPRYFTITRNSAAVLADEYNTFAAPVQTLKAVEAIRNPLLDENLKEEAFQRYNYFISDNWPNSAVGIGYKYAQNDVCVCSDDRYLYTASGNGYCIKWDSYNASIVSKQKVSKDPLYVLDIYNNEENIITVDEKGSVFYLSNGKWISSKNIIAQYGYATEISLSKDFACVFANYDTIIMLSLSNDQISIVNSYKYSDVLGFKQNEDYALLAVLDNDEYKFVKINTKGEIEDTVKLDHKLSSCNVDFKDDDALFVDVDGHVYIYSFNDKSIEKLPIIISSPIFINYINNTAFYYCDRNKGNCLFDYAHGIDLGSILPEAGFVTYSSCRGNTVACITSGYIISENIEDLLPKESIDKEHVVKMFDGKKSQSNGYIRNAEIVDEKYIFADIEKDESNSFTYFIDGGHYYIYNAPKQRSESERADGMQYLYSQPSAVIFTGKPTVVGVFDDGITMVIGASDGTFCEMTSNGTNIVSTTKKQVPTGSPIVRIYFMDSKCFYIEDSDGLFWKVRYGSAAVNSYNELYAEIKNKLHYAMSDDIKSCVTDYVLKQVGAEYAPGHNGKAWE